MARRRFFLPCFAALLGGGCYDFHLFGPEDAPPVSPPRLVSVTVEYRQPNGCINERAACNTPVYFFGTWMRPGGQFALTPDPNGYIWRGVAEQVPVNYPPRGTPYEVRILDPYLLESPTDGFTAERLKVGGEAVTRIESPGGRNEHGLVYIDENGQGRNAF
jgi:hypothetical protein